ncbi:MAG: hypothetical protein NTNFB02_30240 [Nitrospira sp.]
MKRRSTFLRLCIPLAGWMWCSALAAPVLSADERPAAGSPVIMRPTSDRSLSALQCKDTPLGVAEGSNSCEIVSCGRGLKDTCKITCPADKTPKCSCDCLKSFGPMCTEYKANCTCE